MELALRPARAQHENGQWQSVHNSASFDRFLATIAQIQRKRQWYQASLAGAALAHKVVRTLLWDLIRDDTLLFQAAIFVAGTYSNTCGVTHAHLQLGPGLAVLRGASLRALRETAMYAGNSRYKTTAVALLAGWERKFGDQDSYDVHMQAWRTLPVPEHALDEDYVLTLLDVTFEALRGGLDEQAAVNGTSRTSLGGLIRQYDINREDIPPGLRSSFHNWPEARSLLVILCRLAIFDSEAPDSVADIRKLCIDAIAWSPSHTQAWKPVDSYEDTVDDLELNVLYHIRATCVSMTGMLLRIASNFHQIQWVADIEGALWAHTISCHHLRTEEVIRAAHQEIALWTRFVLCLAANDPDTHPLLQRLMTDVNVRSWEDMSALLTRFVWPAHELDERGKVLFQKVMQT